MFQKKTKKTRRLLIRAYPDYGNENDIVKNFGQLQQFRGVRIFQVLRY